MPNRVLSQALQGVCTLPPQHTVGKSPVNLCGASTNHSVQPMSYMRKILTASKLRLFSSAYIRITAGCSVTFSVASSRSLISSTKRASAKKGCRGVEPSEPSHQSQKQHIEQDDHRSQGRFSQRLWAFHVCARTRARISETLTHADTTMRSSCQHFCCFECCCHHKR